MKIKILHGSHVSHLEPVYPTGQLHTQLPFWFVTVPPFMHGFGVHGSLFSHLEPLYEGGHWQKHVPPWFDGTPPF